MSRVEGVDPSSGGAPRRPERGSAMNPGEGGARAEHLADRYAALWEGGGTPDLIAFLEAHPDASPEERSEVIRVDQRRRGQAGAGRPVDHDAVEGPEPARRNELIQALVR